MVPTAAAGGGALGRYLRILVFPSHGFFGPPKRFRVDIGHKLYTRDVRETSARHPRDLRLILDFGMKKSKYRNIFPATQIEDRVTLPWAPATPH